MKIDEATAKSMDVNIWGVYDCDEEPIMTNIYMSDELFDYFIDPIVKRNVDEKLYINYIIPLTHKESLDKNYINFINKATDKNNLLINDSHFVGTCFSARFNTKNEIIYTINKSNTIRKNISNIMLVVCVVFSIILLNLIHYYYTGVIHDKIKDIGIMQSMGIKKKDLINIFIFQSLFIWIVSFIFSIIFSVIILLILNHGFEKEYGVYVKLFYMEIGYVGLSFISSLLLSIISIILPINKLNKEQPMKSILSII